MGQPVVAVIESDVGVRMAIEGLLRAYGFCVELYGTAQQFLDAVKDNAPSCVVMDVQLSDLSGIELARRLLASRLRLPIVFLTGSKDQAWRQQAVEAGGAAFVDRPF
ncbi:MAG TPA: response regulator, partial [Nitrospiraceae bacterium]|nr:response regulator [Nitrospiraceae bacterium]